MKTTNIRSTKCNETKAWFYAIWPEICQPYATAAGVCTGRQTASSIVHFNKLLNYQGDHSPDNLKFPDDSLTVRGTPPRHSACQVLLISCLYDVTVTGGIRNATVHDPKPYT